MREDVLSLAGEAYFESELARRIASTHGGNRPFPMRATRSGPGRSFVFLAAFLVLASFGPLAAIRTASASAETSTPESASALALSTHEAVALQKDGTSAVTIDIDVDPTALADYYREMFGNPTAQVDEAIPIPDQPTVDSTGVVTLSARDEFYQGIVEDQLLWLGLELNISGSTIVPYPSEGGFRVQVVGSGTFNSAEITKLDSGWLVRFDLRLRGVDATDLVLERLFTRVIFASLLLNATSGWQTYESRWATEVSLPPDATFTSPSREATATWAVDFGQGTFAKASASFLSDSVLSVEQTLAVSENPIIAGPRDIRTAVESYMMYEAEYFQAYPAGMTAAVAGLRPDFEKVWTKTYGASEGVTFSDGNLRVSLQASISVTLGLHIGWTDDEFIGETLLQGTAGVSFEASAAGPGYNSWSETIATFRIARFGFFIGPIPAWADLNLEIHGAATFDARGQMTMSMGASVGIYIIAGVHWKSGEGWSPIQYYSFTTSSTGPDITAQDDSELTPSVKFRVILALYSVAGPFVEIEPYADLKVFVDLPGVSGRWSICLGFRINAGAAFAGKIADLLGLSDFSVNILDVPDLACWGDMWGAPIFTVTAAVTPPMPTVDMPVQVSGVASRADGVPDASVPVDGSLILYATRVFTDTTTGVVSAASIPLFSSFSVTTDAGGGYVAAVSTHRCPDPEVHTFYTIDWICPTPGIVVGLIDLYVNIRQVSGPPFPPFGSLDCPVLYLGLPGDPPLLFCADVHLFTTFPILDTTAPVVAATIDPAPTPSGWNNQDVSVVWDVTDDQSGIATSSGCDATTLTDETAGTVVTCTATNNAGLTTSGSVTIRVDRTPPTVTAPADVVVRTVAGRESVPVSYPDPTAADNVGIDSVACEPASGSIFTVGVTTVTCTATDLAGNTATSDFTVTVTLLPRTAVATGDGCTFDRDAADGQQFRLIFAPDNSGDPDSYALRSSNPGQFFLDIVHIGSGPTTLTVDLPYPFVTQGAVPVQGFGSMTADAAGCLVPGTDGVDVVLSPASIALSDYAGTWGTTSRLTIQFDSPGLVLVVIHLDYGLKGSGGYTRSSDDAAVSTQSSSPITNLGSYAFAIDEDGALYDAPAISNVNVFKRFHGFAGIVTDADGNPQTGVRVQIFSPSGQLLADLVTDDDGHYGFAYRHTGRAATYQIGLPDWDRWEDITVRANSYTWLSFRV